MHCSWPLSCRYISVSHKSQWRFTVDIFLCIATSDTVTHDDSLPSFLICCLLLKNLPFSHIRPFLPIFATISPDKSLLEAETPLLQLRTVARSDHVGGSIIEADFEKNPTFWNLVTIDFVLQFRTSGHPNYIQCLRSKHFDQQQLAGVG